MGGHPSVLTGSLQGIAERPLPCNYNVIPLVCALPGANAGGVYAFLYDDRHRDRAGSRTLVLKVRNENQSVCVFVGGRRNLGLFSTNRG
jgi:hypothetical protein